MKLKALCVGLTAARAKKVVTSLERALPLEAEVKMAEARETDLAGRAARCDVIFVGAVMGQKALGTLLDAIRGKAGSVPVVLVYEAEPDGRIFQLALRHDCWLYSEMDRLKRGLTADELAEALRARAEGGETTSRLMDISLSSGPCSTGD
ncbi:MAG: hypothetical protein WAW06_05690 [bacterium]